MATNGTLSNEERFCDAEGVAGPVAVQHTPEGMCPDMPKKNDLIDDIFSSYMSYIGVAEHRNEQKFALSSPHCQLQYTTRCRTHLTRVQYPCQRARGMKQPNNSYCVQVQKVWRTLIIHCLVPKCGIPEFPLAKFGLYDNDADYEIWFRNTHNAGMVRPLMHHTLEAWDDFLPESEGITNPPSKRA